MSEIEENLGLSVVVPLYNETDNVEALYAAIVASLLDYRDDYELILVDDGSTDNTVERIRAIAQKDTRLKLIAFRRNFGQTPAMAAGIDHARGKIIVTMDGDLQNDPRDILELVAHVQDGADLVVGWRFNRQDKFLTRKVPSKIANWIIGKVTGVPIKDNGCSLKAYRADLIKSIPLYSEMHRFIPAMTSIAGANIVEVKVRHHARTRGTSKYGLSRIYKVLFDLLAIKTLTAFSSRPLTWFSALAVPFIIAAGLCVVWAAWLATNSKASLVVATGLVIIFGGGASFILICGVLSELVYKIGRVKPTDFFLVRDVDGRRIDSNATPENGSGY